MCFALWPVWRWDVFRWEQSLPVNLTPTIALGRLKRISDHKPLWSWAWAGIG